MEKIDESRLKEKYKILEAILDERGRRIWSGVEAQELGHGGVSAVSRATGLSRTTVHQGIKEISEGLTRKRNRRKGGGRKKAQENQEGLVDSLESLVDPDSRGDPESPLRWTIKSVRRLSEELPSNGLQSGTPKSIRAFKGARL